MTKARRVAENEGVVEVSTILIPRMQLNHTELLLERRLGYNLASQELHFLHISRRLTEVLEVDELAQVCLPRAANSRLLR